MSWRDGDVPLCKYKDHEWMRDTQGEPRLIIPAFLDEDGTRRLVQVRCLKCGAVTRLEWEEFMRTGKWT